MKKILKITGITAFAAALFFTVSFNGQTESGNLDLASLTKMSEANAECVSTGDPFRDTGRCSALTGNCYALSDPPTCDPYAF